MTTESKYKPGQWVRFHLGERMPFTKRCCGAVFDTFEYLQPFNGRVFKVDQLGLSVCPGCRKANPSSDMPVYLIAQFTVNEILYGAFGAYEREVEIVVADEICKCGHPEKDHEPKDIFGCWECMECEGYEPRQPEEVIEP